MTKEIEISESIIWANQNNWIIKLKPDGRIEFNHEAYPDSNPGDFAKAFIWILENTVEPRINEEKARKILGDAIKEDNSLYCLGTYIGWSREDSTACLDGTYMFTAEYLEAVAWWMKNFKVEK